MKQSKGKAMRYASLPLREEAKHRVKPKDWAVCISDRLVAGNTVKVFKTRCIHSMHTLPLPSHTPPPSPPPKKAHLTPPALPITPLNRSSVHKCLYVCMCRCVFVCTCIAACVCMFLDVYVCVWLFVYWCVCVCRCVCVCVCVCKSFSSIMSTMKSHVIIKLSLER